MAEALAVLAGIIFVHECGHFGAARALGVHVTKFAVGFGPRLLTFRDAEVEYSLSAVPLGGFVAFPDDDPDSPWPKDDPDLLRNRPLAHRAAVVVAGVVANVVFAFALLTAQARCGACGGACACKLTRRCTRRLCLRLARRASRSRWASWSRRTCRACACPRCWACPPRSARACARATSSWRSMASPWRQPQTRWPSL